MEKRLLERLQENRYVVLFVISAMLLTFLNILIRREMYEVASCVGAENSYIYSFISIVLTGLIAALAVSYADKKALYKLAVPLYIVVVAVLAVSAVLYLFVRPYSDYLFYTAGFLFIDIMGRRIVFQPAMLLPLSGLIIYRFCENGEKSLSIRRFIKLSLLMLAPAVLCFFIHHKAATLVYLMAYAAVVIYMKKSDMISISWLKLILALVVVCSLILAYFTFFSRDSGFYNDRIASILSRGGESPYGIGWTRQSIDGLISGSKMLGDKSVLNTDEAYSLFRTADFTLVLFLARYGWIAFAGLMAAAAGLILAIVMMIKHIRLNSLAKTVPVFAASFIVGQALLNILGTAVIDTGFIGFPFLSSQYVIVADLVAAAVLLKNCETSINTKKTV